MFEGVSFCKEDNRTVYDHGNGDTTQVSWPNNIDMDILFSNKDGAISGWIFASFDENGEKYYLKSMNTGKCTVKEEQNRVDPVQLVRNMKRRAKQEIQDMLNMHK